LEGGVSSELQIKIDENNFSQSEIFPKLNKQNLFTAAIFGLKKLLIIHNREMRIALI